MGSASASSKLVYGFKAEIITKTLKRDVKGYDPKTGKALIQQHSTLSLSIKIKDHLLFIGEHKSTFQEDSLSTRYTFGLSDWIRRERLAPFEDKFTFYENYSDEEPDEVFEGMIAEPVGNMLVFGYKLSECYVSGYRDEDKLGSFDDIDGLKLMNFKEALKTIGFPEDLEPELILYTEMSY